MKYILLLVFVIFVYPVRPTSNALSVVTVENGAIMGNALPRYGILCQDANVQGNPHDSFETLYTLPKGERVRLHEQSRGVDRSWAMIAPAHWIKLSTLCGF